MKSFFLFLFVYYNTLACPKDLFQGTNSDYCYKFVGDPESWDSANENCIELKGTLASVNDESLNDIFVNVSRSKLGNDKSVWLGASSDLSANGSEWLWIDERKNALWNGWASGKTIRNKNDLFNFLGEPSIKEASCLSLRLNNSKWYSRECMAAKPYICQISQNSSNFS